MPPSPQNPFRTSVTVDNQFFTDRAEELTRIKQALTTPAARLLRYGERRIGKSSAIARAIRQIQAQNVLRAVAVQASGLTSAATQERFGLTNSSATSQALTAFVEDGRLVRDDAAGGYTFDNPFLRGWVIDRTLPDLGLRYPITHRPTRG